MFFFFFPLINNLQCHNRQHKASNCQLSNWQLCYLTTLFLKAKLIQLEVQFINTLQIFFVQTNLIEMYLVILSKRTIINHFSFSSDRCHHGLCQPQSVRAQDDVSGGPSARVPLGHDPFPLHFPNSKYMEVVP